MFKDIYGQDHVIRTLANAIAKERVSSGYIFAGHRGIGKTTVARILAMALNCKKFTDGEPCSECTSCREIRSGNSKDVIEIDAATNRGIDEVRELRENVRYKSTRDRYKILILDEAHQITGPAFNALLKTLEEPPPYVVFILATTQGEDIPQTIRSRCQLFRFRSSSLKDISTIVTNICLLEDIKMAPDTVDLVAEAGDGSIRDSLSFLDQLIACCGMEVTTEDVLRFTGNVDPGIFEKLLGHVANLSTRDVLLSTNRMWKMGYDPGFLTKELCKFIHHCMVAKFDRRLLQIPEEKQLAAARVAQKFSDYGLSRFLKVLLSNQGPMATGQDQRFHFELSVLEMVHFIKERPSCMEPIN